MISYISHTIKTCHQLPHHRILVHSVGIFGYLAIWLRAKTIDDKGCGFPLHLKADVCQVDADDDDDDKGCGFPLHLKADICQVDADDDDDDD